MPVEDISRHLHQPRKRYAGVHMQQGRVLVDSDFNEAEEIDAEDERRTAVDLIGPAGTSNTGFLVSNPRPAQVTLPSGATVDTYDFDYANGSYFVGGVRFEVEAPRGGETFLRQPDWLQLDNGEAALPAVPTTAELRELPNVERFDFVYLRGWEQPITAVEDGELREAALGGPDTSTRVRRMRRLEVVTNTPASCAEAFAALIQQVTAPVHRFDGANMELVSAARLGLGFTQGPADDPCRPEIEGGFLGAENETFRVQLTAPNRLVWSRDAAAPLYRVQVEAEGAHNVVVRFSTPPRDQASQPLAGQAVEILRWGALLPNGERQAESAGHLSAVARSYDPQTRTLILHTPVPQDYLDWLARHPELRGEDEPAPGFFYLRLWTGVSDDADAPAIEVTPGTPITLGRTGLAATVSAPGLAGEHWLVSARPHPPNVVVPWELEGAPGAAAAGPRVRLAPVALIRWFVRGNEVVSDVRDCRVRFEPLTRLRGCCTVTVGDGVRSFGHVQSIQQAIDLLGPDGGKVCLLAGVFAERIDLSGRANITIEGCGRRTVVTNPAGEAGHAGIGALPRPLIDVSGGERLGLRHFAVRATGLIAIGASKLVRALSLCELWLDAAGVEGTPGVMPLPAVQVLASDQLLIERCHVHMDDVRSPYPAVFARGRGVALVDTEVAVGDDDTRLHQAWGGVQIGGASVDVEIRACRIVGGHGHGITLGALWYVPRVELWRPDHVVELMNLRELCPLGHCLVRRIDFCDHVVVVPPVHDDPAGPRFPVPDGNLDDVCIIGNVIARHGASGISVAGFWGPRTTGGIAIDPAAMLASHWIAVNGLRVTDNDIEDNLRAAPQVDADRAVHQVLGGVALSVVSDLVVRRNRIRRNGDGHDGPVCGVGALVAYRTEIDDNHIEGNGRVAVRPMAGLRGGIMILLALRSGLLFATRRPGLPARAAEVRRNRVTQPEGRALWIDSSVGGVEVAGNRLESWGERARSHGMSHDLPPVRYGNASAPAAGACVQIVDYSIARDLATSSFVLVLGYLLDGGIRFLDNETMLRWTNRGGAASSVLLVARSEETAVRDNRMTAAMGGRLAANSTVPQFLDAVARNDADLSAHSYLLFHVVAAGDAVHTSNNRVAEGPTDAAGSVLAIHANKSGVYLSAVYNHATHCVYTIPESGDRTGNQVRFEHARCSYDVGHHPWQVVPLRVD